MVDTTYFSHVMPDDTHNNRSVKPEHPVCSASTIQVPWYLLPVRCKAAGKWRWGRLHCPSHHDIREHAIPPSRLCLITRIFLSKRHVSKYERAKCRIKEACHGADLQSPTTTLSPPSMATSNQNHLSADAKPDNTIELDDNVVQKLTESDAKFVNLTSEAKASCDRHNPSLRDAQGAFVAKGY